MEPLDRIRALLDTGDTPAAATALADLVRDSPGITVTKEYVLLAAAMAIPLLVFLNTPAGKQWQKERREGGV